MDFSEVAMDASSFAERISWLKIEPKVSIFPVLEAENQLLVPMLRRKIFSFL